MLSKAEPISILILMCELSLRKFSKFEISNDLTDGDIKNLITSYERKRKIIFFNPICTLMSNTQLNVLSEIDKN